MENKIDRQELFPLPFTYKKTLDTKMEKPKVSVKRIPEDQIRLPEIKPETVYYFIEERQS